MRGLHFFFEDELADIECRLDYRITVTVLFASPRGEKRLSTGTREEGWRESVGRRVTRDSLEQRLRRVFLTSSLVLSTPRTQSANECRLVSQLILPRPFYQEVESANEQNAGA